MKILIIASLFPPYHRGGAEVVALTVATELAKHHEVIVLTVCPYSGRASLHPQIEDRQVVPGVQVMRFFPLNIFSFINIGRHNAVSRLVWHLLDMFNVHTWWAVRHVLKEITPDVVLTHNLKGIGYTAPLAIRRYIKTKQGKNMRWIHTIHDLGPLYPRGLLAFGKEKSFDTTSLLVRLYGCINRALFGSPEIVVSRSQFFLDYFKSRGWFRVSRTERFTHDVARRSNALAQAPTGIFKFLFVGQFEEYKGLAVLLEAWKIAQAKGLQAELHFVGRGSMEEVVKEAATNDTSIIYHGESLTNPSLLSDLIPRMHAVVVPTLVYENTPLVLVEAFAAGLPVIASSIGGVPEAFTNGEAGYLATPASAAELAAAMANITNAPWMKLHDAALLDSQKYDASGLASEMEKLLSDSQKR